MEGLGTLSVIWGVNIKFSSQIQTLSIGTELKAPLIKAEKWNQEAME